MNFTVHLVSKNGANTPAANRSCGDASKHDSVIQQKLQSFAVPLFLCCRKKRRFICRFSAINREVLWSECYREIGRQ